MMDLAGLTDADRVVLMEQAFSTVDEVCSQLTGAEWDAPTDLPGWSVKDNLSHLAHYESIAAGMPQPPERPTAHLTHMKDDFGRRNEIGVEARRPLPGPQILEEFRTATTARLKQLADFDEQRWSAPTKSPVGELETRNFLGIRILDVFYHEQDIRRATNRPGHLDGQVAAFVFTRFAQLSVPRIVVKAGQAPDGSVVVFDVAAPGEPFAVEVKDGKGVLVPPPADATARIATDFEAFLCLIGGRRTREQLGERVRIDGDAALAGRILDNLVVVP
jgi:uncharacterized protein (TIGR03083 family)